jgi:diguanylate cyclase (GGDEF)-like protein
MSQPLSPVPAECSDADRIASLQAQLDAQARLIRQQAASLAHSQKTFARASAAARIGVWECILADESLIWTDVVYDIFDLPRGSALDRGATLKCYPAESLKALTLRRSKAIADRTGFSLETEIVTAKGNRRWIRITASVECVDGVAVRIFGMKQDITEERFQSKLAELTLAESGDNKPFGALLLIDLDAFKSVNDGYGHAAGDEWLRQAGQRIRHVCDGAELVARIGGDEFAVILGAQLPFAEISEAARAIVEALFRPMLFRDRRLQLGASVGVALADDCTPAQLFLMADTALYAAKNAGRNTFRIHKPGSGKHGTGSSAAA